MMGTKQGDTMSRGTCPEGDNRDTPKGGVSRLSRLPHLGSVPVLIELAEKVRRLSPSHRDPERFHMDKSEIERDLRRLARTVTHG